MSKSGDTIKFYRDTCHPYPYVPITGRSTAEVCKIISAGQLSEKSSFVIERVKAIAGKPDSLSSVVKDQTRDDIHRHELRSSYVRRKKHKKGMASISDVLERGNQPVPLETAVLLRKEP